MTSHPARQSGSQEGGLKSGLCGRLFLVHVDGSAAELLSSQTMEEVLYQAYSDPAAVLLKEPLPDSRGAFTPRRIYPDVGNVFHPTS